MSSARQKIKNWVLFRRSFSQSFKDFSAKVEKWKAFSLGKDGKLFFCTSILLRGEKCRVFCPIFDKLLWGSKRKMLSNQKKKNVLFHILKALLKTLMKNFLPKLEYLRPQSIKSLFLWRKKELKVPLDTKNEKLGTFSAKNCLKSENFLLEVHDWKNVSAAKFCQIVLLH